MIKIERKQTAKTQKAIASLQQAKIKKRSYNTPEVNAALSEIFHGKCYICESKGITSYQIDHLIPHRGDEKLKYDWENLFLACAHCNNTKLDKYEPIIDCTKEDVEKKIAFRKKGYFGTDEQLLFECLDHDETTVNTVRLLQEVYYGSTPQKQMEARTIRRNLRKELSEFKNEVREYLEAEDGDKEDLEYELKRQLRDASPYAAFKRWLIRDNQSAFPELLKYIKD